MKKVLSIILSVVMLLSTSVVFAEEPKGDGTPPRYYTFEELTGLSREDIDHIVIRSGIDGVGYSTAYDKIIETYEQKKEGIPAFIFEVTMQNHGGYTDSYKNFTPNIKVEEFEHKALNQYLSLLQVSDAELEKLIAYFNKEEEKTILVFFGDHQPNDYVVNSILQWNRKSSLEVSEEETAKLRYVVPYMIWANYDIEEQTNADTDISFLGANMLEIAGLPTSAYQKFLLEMENTLQQVSQKTESEQESVKAEYEEMYQILQYYFMFE